MISARHARSAALACALALGPLMGVGAHAQPSKPAPAAKPAPKLPAVDLSAELLYRIMMAEIAIQRGQAATGVQTMIEIARETGDPRLAQRATEMAIDARLAKEALEAASQWIKADPNSQRARQVAVALLAAQDNLAESRVPLEQWLAADPANAGSNFIQLSQVMARHKDKKGVYDLLRVLARPYGKVAEVRLALAQAASNAGNNDATLAESRAALQLKPELEFAALFHAQALQRRSNAEALKFLGGYLEGQPQAKEVRLGYARLLAAEKRQADARRQFDLLIEQSPKDADIAMAVGAMALQSGDRDAAEKHLQHALATGHKSPDTIWVMLGQINEDRKQYEEALKYYAGVGAGEQYLHAQSRYAAVLQKLGKLAEARSHLQSIQPRDNAQRLQLVQAEANLLREANDYAGAYDLLGKTLEGAPDSVDLLYDQAMVAEKLDRIDVLERNLRKIISMQPNHAHAHNALGYTFADRNMRLPEARKLIEKALELSPQDGYIVDSLGWVLYRMGELREAIVQLRRAYELRPEAEVGAHLGEVLWVDGKREEAIKIWTDMLKEGPDNDTLRSTLKRFAPHLLPVK